MTFYYDELRDTHQANTYPIEPFLWGIPSKEKGQVTHALFSPSFADARPTSTMSWFYMFWKLKHIDGMENLNTSEVTSMLSMFAYCSSLDSIDVSRFDTSKVEDMEGMFYACSSLAELDLSSFDISQGCATSTLLKDCTSLRRLHVSPSMARLSEYSCPHVGEQAPSAGRQFRNAQNIEVDNPQGVFGDFHNSHNRVEDWENKIIQSTKSHK